MDRIDSSEELSSAFAEGKMLGVLIVKDSNGEYGFLAGFSGNVGGKSIIEGFVPPVYDLMDPSGYFKQGEAELNIINSKISELVHNSASSELHTRLAEAEAMMQAEIAAHKERMVAAKAERDKARTESFDSVNASDSLIRESQFMKAELKRIKDKWKAEIESIKERIAAHQAEISDLKQMRARKSDELQRWIFGQYIVHNAAGEQSSILEIFTAQGLMPPGGTGDCAAPKLLNHAFIKGLKPVAMGEFWYGKSPDTAVRTHGHFYPSCTSKCGPLLAYMLKGLMPTGGWDVKTESLPTESEAGIVYEDDCIMAVSKPSGMPSVPGLDGRESLQEWIQNRMGIKVFPVHRLDMDTSGIIVFAKTAEAEVNLKKQFEEHTVRKTYKARLSPADTHRFAGNTPILKPGDKGTVELPLSPDYDERPRQKVDKSQGKPSLTEYEVLSVNEDGTTDILFHPHTGRTHQLRVHSAHIMGLGRPILGDLLYGGCSDASEKGLRAANLCLHALRITFRHPSSDEEITLQV